MKRLQAQAVHYAFAPPLDLAGGIEQLGFVQADPIRAPARAQDLILRQRVAGYRAGDLEALYAELDLEEDFLYAYGFMPRSTWQLLHPRKKSFRLTALERRVLHLVTELGEAHPASLEPHLGTQRAVNAWGGYSKASTRALHELHWYGLIRVVRRDKGIRVYTALPSKPQPTIEPESERLRRVVRLVARIFTPVPERSLRQVLNLLTYSHIPAARTRPLLAELIETGELIKESIAGLDYVRPSGLPAPVDEAPPRVRILAPFDPLVWDRRRFEHLWGWAYRFEAYTPAAKRTMGYYAMPLLWGREVVGWVNAEAGAGGSISLQPAFVKSRPPGRAFARAYEEEAESFARFLSAR